MTLDRGLEIFEKMAATAETISALARDTSQFFVNHSWLGGMLTNWKTISNSIKRFKKLSEDLKSESTGFTKKEILILGNERDKIFEKAKEDLNYRPKINLEEGMRRSIKWCLDNGHKI